MSEPRITISAGSAWPGDDPFTGHRTSLDVLAQTPSGIDGIAALLALPARGPWAAPVGRTLAIAASMTASLEPHGWRLGLTSDGTQLRAGRMLGGDLEALALAAVGHEGPVTVPVVGPYSLAASVWLPVGERVLADGVALADLVASLQHGVLDHAAALRAARSLPLALTPPLPDDDDGDGDGEAGTGATVGATAPRPDVVLLHEPLLGQVMAGGVPTFSGMSRLRQHRAEAVTARLADLVRAWAPHDVVIQIPADASVIRAAGAAGPAGLALDTSSLGPAGWEALAEQVELGVTVWSASVPHAVDDGGDPRVAARAFIDPWRSLGLGVDDLDLVLLPRPGLADLTPEHALATLRGTARVASELGEMLARG